MCLQSCVYGVNVYNRSGTFSGRQGFREVVSTCTDVRAREVVSTCTDYLPGGVLTTPRGFQLSGPPSSSPRLGNMLPGPLEPAPVLARCVLSQGSNHARPWLEPGSNQDRTRFEPGSVGRAGSSEARTKFKLGKLWRLKSVLPSRRNAHFHILGGFGVEK